MLAFNRGVVSRLALARVDLKRISLSAEEMTNWVPRVLGSMMLRPGLEFLGSSKSDAAARYLPFVFSTSDKALVELTDSVMRVWIDDALVTRASVSSAVTNGSFTVDVANWTDNDEAGGTSAWVVGGYLGLTGDGTSAAIRDQSVVVAAGDLSVEHALRIVVQRGPVTLRVGSTVGGDDYISETELLTGTHSLTLTPTGNFNIRFLSRLKRQVLVDSCNVEASGTMEVTAPWLAADLGKIRAHWETSQSGDVLFAACEGYQQRRIERRSTRSWSVVRYQASDGPLRVENTGPITLTPSALSGNITVTASAAFFKSTNGPSTNSDGSIFRITSNGQNVSASIAVENTFTNAIMVEGVDAQRIFTVTVDEDAVGAATFTLQRSLVSDSGPWTDVIQWTADVTTPFDDGLDNQIAWYRLGVKTGDYVNGTHAVSLAYTVGSIDGFVRVTLFTSSTVVSAEVLSDLGGTAATDSWSEGEWSDRRGWPTAVGFVEGRLGWAGQNGIWLSVSDAFDSYNASVEGDSGPIARTIGSGPVDRINWILPLQRLLLGAEGAEFVCKSSSLDEPVTPTNFNIKTSSTQGSASVSAAIIDQQGVFVQRGGTRVFEISFGDNYEFATTQLSALVPDIGSPSITRIAVQRQPDTRVHFVRSDGTVALLVFDKVEQVSCWIEIETLSGDLIEDVAVVPGDAGSEEDKVYYHVKRTINGSTKRYLEKWAKESECIGGALNKQADSFLTYTGAVTTSIPAAHLVGESVVAWVNGTCPEDADGDPQTYTVSAGGTITLATAATNVVVGLPYTSRWKSSKIARFEASVAFGDMKNIKGLALVLADVHRKGLKFGPDFDNLDDLPSVEDGAAVSADAIRTEYEGDPMPFPGIWDTDTRLCLQAQAPRPCTVLGAVPDVEAH